MKIKTDLSFSNLVNSSNVIGTLNEFFPYKESYNPLMLKILKEKYNINVETPSVYDPFTGTGSTFLSPNIINVFGNDTNPLAVKVSEAKLTPLNIKDIDNTLRDIENIFTFKLKNHSFPKWNSYHKYVDKNKYNYIMSLIESIFNKTSQVIYRYIKYVIISNLDKVFNYKRDGNGIKHRQSKITYEHLEEYLKSLIIRSLISKKEFDKDSTIKKINIFNKSSILVENLIGEIDICVTSPPYANMFDYLEVYKIELWTSGLVKTYDQWRGLKKQALRSNMNSNLDKKEKINNIKLNTTVSKLNKMGFDDKKIAMINNYFFDMKQVLQNLYKYLKPESYAFIIVGNSFYMGEPIVTDEILAQEASKIGFFLQEIMIARKLNTSPQQMNILSEKNKKYLRESIIVLRR